MNVLNNHSTRLERYKGILRDKELVSLLGRELSHRNQRFGVADLKGHVFSFKICCAYPASLASDKFCVEGK